MDNEDDPDTPYRRRPRTHFGPHPAACAPPPDSLWKSPLHAPHHRLGCRPARGHKQKVVYQAHHQALRSQALRSGASGWCSVGCAPLGGGSPLALLPRLICRERHITVGLRLPRTASGSTPASISPAGDPTYAGADPNPGTRPQRPQGTTVHRVGGSETTSGGSGTTTMIGSDTTNAAAVSWRPRCIGRGP